MKNTKVKQKALITFICVLAVVAIIGISHILKAQIVRNDETQALFIGGYDIIEIIPVAISLLEAFGVVISLVIAARQLIDSKEIARATFIAEINRSFVENDRYMALYDAFQNCYDKKCQSYIDGTCKCDASSKCSLDFPKSDVSNYLTFFETIYLLIKAHAINFNVIDDLFAYRFFLAVHHKFIQQAKLQPQPQNFKNIFRLHHDWVAYRKAHGKSMTGVYSQNPLDTMELPDNISYQSLIE